MIVAWWLYLRQAFFGRVFGKQRFRLCRNLEFLSWVLSFFLELLSFFLNIFKKKPISPLKNWQLLQYFYVDLVFYANFNHFSVFSPIHPLILVIFCCSLIKFCRNLEFFAWVLSYFYEAWVFSSLSFFQTVQKKSLV